MSYQEEIYQLRIPTRTASGKEKLLEMPLFYHGECQTWISSSSILSSLVL